MLSNFERIIALRYLRPDRKETFTSLIALFSFLGIAFGVFTLIVVMSVMGGFRQELLTRVLGLQPHVVVFPVGHQIDNYLSVVRKINDVKNIETISPIIRAQVLARANGNVSGALVYGITGSDLLKREKIVSGLSVNSIQSYKSGSGIIIGYRLAEKFGLTVGDSISLISPSTTFTVMGGVPRTRAYKVIATFNVDMSEYDSNLIFMPMRLAQIHFKYRNSVSSIELTTSDPDQAELVTLALKNVLGAKFKVRDWKQVNATYFGVLDVERNVMFVILLLIILIAAFNIISSMIMLVKSKRRQIGILRTIGATRAQVMKIFFANGILIGFSGTVFGVISGIIFALYIEEIRQFVESIIGRQVFPPEFYFLSQLPSRIDAMEVLTVSLVALFLSLIATLYPAWRAASLDPVEALRNE